MSLTFSAVFKASPHCIASPDGNFVAALQPSQISVRSTRTLAVEYLLKLPSGLSGGITHFLWGPESRHVLVGTADRILVLDALSNSRDQDCVVQMPAGVMARTTAVLFGPTDVDLVVCSPHGTKLTLANLSTGRLVEVTNPKWHSSHASSSSSAATRGCAFRPHAQQLALLTRTAGRDMVSIHGLSDSDEPSARVLRAWHPDCTDAQGLRWSPDGRWLAVWESPAYGHKCLLYSPDGHLVKLWAGPAGVPGKHLDLAAGVRELQFSPSAARLALADHAATVHVLDMTTLTELLRLTHPTTIMPRDTLQIWQEQISMSQAGKISRSFVRGLQPVFPGERLPGDKPNDSRATCSIALHDSSSNLLATRLDNSKSTIWIWDLAAAELRAVLLFHADVSSIDWHPKIHELLLIRCSGEGGGPSFLWDPISGGPLVLDLSDRIAEGQVTGRVHAEWLNLDRDAAGLLLRDDKQYVIASFSESADDRPVWSQNGRNDFDITDDGSRSESPLELIPAPTRDDFDDDPPVLDGSDLDDTFHFRKVAAT